MGWERKVTSSLLCDYFLCWVYGVYLLCVLQKEEANSAAAEKSDSSKKEFYIKERFDSVQDALKLFQDDDLVLKPGEVMMVESGACWLSCKLCWHLQEI